MTNIVIREFLAPEYSSTSSCIYCFHGIPDYDEEINSFVDISDCRNRIRLHAQSKEPISQYLERLRVIVHSLETYIHAVESTGIV
jgi:hypothetical protein